MKPAAATTNASPAVKAPRRTRTAPPVPYANTARTPPAPATPILALTCRVRTTPAASDGTCLCNEGFIPELTPVPATTPCEPELQLYCADPCASVNCPANSKCVAGKCVCNRGYVDPDPDDNDPQCIDPCSISQCDDREYCLLGRCLCKTGFEDPDVDGHCTVECRPGTHDPDDDGKCTKICNWDEMDQAAIESLNPSGRNPSSGQKPTDA